MEDKLTKVGDMLEGLRNAYETLHETYHKIGLHMVADTYAFVADDLATVLYVLNDASEEVLNDATES